MKRIRSESLVALALLATLGAAACGGTGRAAGPAETGPGFPVVVAGAVIPSLPERIVSVSASHTEILYALGAGERIVATDRFSDYPAEARATPKLDAFNLSVEAVASFHPDLVVLSFDPGEVRSGLAALGIPALVFDPPATLDDVYAQIADLGTASGLAPEAGSLVEAMRADVARLTSGVPRAAEAPSYYYELDPTLYSATSATFIGSLFSLLGLENVADAAGPDRYGYAQLSAEFILAADPEFIFLADTRCCGQSAVTVAARPGWGGLSAVVGGRVVELDDDVASRWGPRVVGLLATVAEAVYGTAAG